MRVARLEPGEVAAVMPGIAAEADQEPGQVAVALGDAEILGIVEEAAQAGSPSRRCC
jgi:hypothetical protein